MQLADGRFQSGQAKTAPDLFRQRVAHRRQLIREPLQDRTEQPGVHLARGFVDGHDAPGVQALVALLVVPRATPRTPGCIIESSRE